MGFARNGVYSLLACTLLCLVAAGCASPPTPSAPTAATPGVALEACHLSAPGSSARLAAKCGALTVYEDRAAQAGRQIALHIAVIPALSRNPAPDPLFFITGGPGGAASQDFLPVWPAFRRINEERDIVLVDQRGTGQSHPLECPEGEEEGELEAEIARCLAQLDGDPAFYTTAVAADDLDDVRAALGYERINLYGVSYGTRVALTYLRQHGERVRTAILDGVLPQDEALGESVGRDAQRALDLIFARCAADAACNTAFPDLRREFDSLLTGLETQPVTVTIPHPTTAEPTEVKLTRRAFAQTVRLLSYGQETVALLPLLIHTAVASGDYSRLAAQSLIVGGQLEATISEGMHHSVVCAEDAPFYSRDELAAEKTSYLGDLYTEIEDICALWPARAAPAEFKAPVASDAPVLLLSGEADPVTPPANAERAARTLPNSLHLIAPGQGHGVLVRGCVHRVATEFVRQGAFTGLDTSCVGQMRPMPFFTSFTGPNPEAAQ